MSFIGYYQIVEKLDELLRAQGFKTVTIGDIFEVDLNRQNIYPLAHIITNSSEKVGAVTSYNFNIIGMDITDFSKEDLREQIDPVFGIDNTVDVHHDIHVRLSTVAEIFRRGDAFSETYQLNGNPQLLPFKERFENMLAGWNLNMVIYIPNESSIC